jgi:hypothetical protein
MVCHPATRRERNEREKSVPNKPYPVEISTEVMRKHGTHISPHKPILCWAYAAKVLVARLRFRWIIHPGIFVSPLKYTEFMKIQ